MRKWRRFKWIAFPLAITLGAGGAALGFGKAVIMLVMAAVLVPLAIVLRD